MANQIATTERTTRQTERCSKDEAAALRKNHVRRLGALSELRILAKGNKLFGALRAIEFGKEGVWKITKRVAPPFLLGAIPHTPATVMGLRDESEFRLAHT